MQQNNELYYIDCGAHFGETVKEFLDTGVITSEYNVICFEPNPKSFEKLSENTDLFSKFKTVELNQKAVWESNESKTFLMECYAPEKYDGQGSTLIPEHSWRPNDYGVYDRSISVITVDLDSLIKTLIDNHDTTPNIVVKLDIEGSEFVVLEKMITSGTIKKISKLYIEFHAWAMRDNTQQYQVRQEKIITKLTEFELNWSMWK